MTDEGTILDLRSTIFSRSIVNRTSYLVHLHFMTSDKIKSLTDATLQVKALQFVDLVVFFNEDTPLELISLLLPNVLVKGSDYLAENIVGADVVKKSGGVVKTVDFVPGYSTTRIVEKIKKS